MKLVSLPLLFFFALLFNLCQCRTAINLYALVDGNKIKIDQPNDIIYAFGKVLLLLEADDLSATTVKVRTTFYNSGSHETGQTIEIEHAGLPFSVSSTPDGLNARLDFSPEDPEDYKMTTETVTIDFLSWPIVKLIRSEDRPAVARKLAISGKIVELTKN